MVTLTGSFRNSFIELLGSKNSDKDKLERIRKSGGIMMA